MLEAKKITPAEEIDQTDSTDEEVDIQQLNEEKAEFSVQDEKPREVGKEVESIRKATAEAGREPKRDHRWMKETFGIFSSAQCHYCQKAMNGLRKKGFVCEGTTLLTIHMVSCPHFLFRCCCTELGCHAFAHSRCRKEIGANCTSDAQNDKSVSDLPVEVAASN